MKEEWYEGDFKKKYPNGVLCWVWDDNLEPKMYVIIDIDYNSNYKFVTCCRENFKYAKPVRPEEAPAIIGE